MQNAEIISHEGNNYVIKNADYNADIFSKSMIIIGFTGMNGTNNDVIYEYKLEGAYDTISKKSEDGAIENNETDTEENSDQNDNWTCTNVDEIDFAISNLEIIFCGYDNEICVTQDVGLLENVGEFRVRWESNKPGIINNNGIVNRPHDKSELVILTAYIEDGNMVRTKDFKVKVAKDKYDKYDYQDVLVVDDLIQLYKYNTDADDLEITMQKEGIIDYLRGSISDIKIETPKEAFLALYGIKNFLGVDDFEESVVFDKIENYNKYVRFRFKQLFEGIPVEGAFLNIIVDSEGDILLLNNKFQKVEPDSEMKIQIENATEIFNSYDGFESDLTNINLAFFWWDGKYYLTWKIESIEKENLCPSTTYIDVLNGDILFSDIDTVNTLVEKTSDEIGLTREIEYVIKKGKKQIVDNDRKLFVVERTDVSDLNTTIESDAAWEYDESENSKETWKRAVSTYNAIREVYDYYKGKWGIKNINQYGNYVPLAINVKKWGISLNGESTSYDYQAAFCARTCSFGFGNEDCSEYGEISMGNSSIVVAHEYTHGVINLVSHELINGNYLYESSSINEGYADVFGLLIAGSDDWVIKTRGGYEIRDCRNDINYELLETTYNPKLYKSKYGSEYCHENSVVLSKACYYMLQHGVTREQLEEIIWLSLLSEYTIQSTFKDAKEYIVEATKILYKKNDDILRVVEDAFECVGVIGNNDIRLTGHDYINFLNGKVVEPNDDDDSTEYRPLKGVEIVVKSVASGRKWFVKTDANGCYSLKTWAQNSKLEPGDYNVEYTKSGYRTYKTTIKIESGKNLFLERVILIPEVYSYTGKIHGYIIDSSTGTGIQGIWVYISDVDGKKVYESKTDAQGYFCSDKLESGYYSIKAWDSRLYDYVEGGRDYTYSEINKKIVLTEKIDWMGINIALTRKIEIGKARIVLEWGKMPKDLDAHFVGYMAVDECDDYNDGYDHHSYEEVVHVYYRNKSFYRNGKQEIGLDIDDINGFGPETISIYNLSSDKYCYYVHRFSDDGIFDDSDAIVRVFIYESGKEVSNYIFTVPNNGNGSYWNVFVCYPDINEGTLVIEPINTISEYKPLG